MSMTRQSSSAVCWYIRYLHSSYYVSVTNVGMIAIKLLL